MQRLILTGNDDLTTDLQSLPTTTVSFADNLTCDLLIPRSGHYNVDLLGSNTTFANHYSDYYLPNDNVFLNTGRTTLGNATGDSIRANLGLDTTACLRTDMAGTITAFSRMDLSPIRLLTGQTTIYNSNVAPITIEAFSATYSVSQDRGFSIVQENNNSILVLGSSTSVAPVIAAGDVSVNALTVTASSSPWDILIYGGLTVTGSSDTTFNNRGRLQLGTGSALATNTHSFGGSLSATSNSIMSIAGTLDVTGNITFSPNTVNILQNSDSRIATTGGTISLYDLVLSDGVSLAVGDSDTGAITLNGVSGTYGGAVSDVSFESVSTVAASGIFHGDLGAVSILNSTVQLSPKTFSPTRS